METSHLNTAQKIIAMGGGFILVGVVITISIVCHWLPDQKRARRLWTVSIPCLMIGIVLIVIGITMR